jgi:hypothetical protein
LALAQEFTMATFHTALMVGVALLAGGSTPAPQEPTAPVAGTATKNWLVPPGKDPFGNIAFGTLPTHPNRRSPQERDMSGRPSPRPRIVCGMTVVPVKPDSDPKMVMTPKPDSRVDYKIRTVAPMVCRD